MTLHLISKLVLSGALTFDLGTTTGGRELNPVLGRGNFGARQVILASGITAGFLWLEHRYPEHHRVFTYTNFAIAGAHAAVGAHNLGVH